MSIDEKDSLKQEESLKCKVSECYYVDGCILLEKFKKLPKDKNDCSYFKTYKDIEKKKKTNAQSDN